MLDPVRWERSPWSIFDELESLQEDMNRLFTGEASGHAGTAWRRPPRYARTGRPAYPLMNVWSSGDGIVIDAELPGVEAKDVDVSVMGDQLTIHGKVNADEEPEGEVFHRRERPAGEFTRTLQLPFRADAGGVKANYRNGLLRLTVPRSEEEKPKKIQIEG